jgi:hypothetical protein
MTVRLHYFLLRSLFLLLNPLLQRPDLGVLAIGVELLQLRSQAGALGS